MSLIEISDNYNTFVAQHCGAITLERDEVISDIEEISKKSLAQLKEDRNILVYPDNFGDNGDGLNRKDTFVCSLLKTTTKVNKKAIKTIAILYSNNVLGYIGIGKTELKIFSRFDSGLSCVDDNDQPKSLTTIKSREDFFMYYLLGKVFAINLINLDFSKDNSNLYRDLLWLMFPNFFKNALSQGVYKEYQTRNYNDSKVKGVIDVSRHIRKNIPFIGNVAYHNREYSSDNDMTELIRHTIEYMKENGVGNSILNSDYDTKLYVDQIIQATYQYRRNDRADIITRNLKPKVHPYLTEYTELQRICLEILKGDGLSYGKDTNDDKIHGILFDGAWLWESYIYTIISDLGFEHPDNIKKEGAFKMFKRKGEFSSDGFDTSDFNNDSRSAYPDFYNDICILDAKYKHIENKVERDDLYQVISYMHVMKRKIGGYIYPYQPSNEDDTIKAKHYILEGDGDLIATIPFKVPYYKKADERSWKQFVQDMEKEEMVLKESIMSLPEFYKKVHP